MQHLGGRGGGARRGRPPMAMQYATGNIITKGQMPIRMGKKPLAGLRGGKAYQTITMPVAAGGATPQALLNKSVVITPATKGGGLSTSKAVRNIKLNPKLTVTTTPKVTTAMSSTTNKVTTAMSSTTSKVTTTLPSTSGVAGITKLPGTSVIPKLTKKTTLSQLANLHRNEKLRKLNQAKKEEKDTGSVKVENEGKSESGEEREPSNEMKVETEDQKPTEKEPKLEGKVGGDESEGPVNLVNKKEDASNPKKEENEANEPAVSESGSVQGTESGIGLTNESTGQNMADQLSDSAASGMSQTTENSSPVPGKQDDKMGSSNTNNATGLDTSDGRSANLADDNASPSLHSNEVVLGAPSKSAVGFGMRDLTKPLSSSISSSDSRTGIVKPQVQQTPNKPTASLTPLQSMSNLLPPGGPGPPGAPHSSLASTTLPHLPPFSSQQAFHSSQPLFQPFLQQTSQQQQQSGVTSSTTNSSSWSKSNVDTVSSSSLGSNVAQVAPHVHQSGMSSSSTYTASQSSFIPSTTQGQFSGSSGNYGTMSTMSSTVPPTTQQSTTATTYPTMSESPQLSQQQHQSQQSQQSSLSSTLAHASGGLVPSSRSGGLGGADSPLNLSHLLNSQVFDSVPEDLSSPHSHASALDYLNYTLSTGTSAFRRPDYQATLSPDLQSLINSATSQQSLTSSLPSAAHSSSNPAVSSPSPFPAYQPPTYPQYAPSYRTGTSVSASPYAAYAGQYSPYAAQYPPGLAPHAATTPQPSAMGQYGALHTPPNPYQTYPAPPTPGRSPYSSTLGGFSHGPYPPM